MPPISLLIKPASSLCNMRCSYCFYEDVAKNRTIPSYGMMTPETAERVVSGAFAVASGGCHFAFQGGEPTLAGLEYYRRFLALVQQYNIRRVPVSYSIQTNGYAVDPEWASFFAENQFLVGLSLDGNKEINDLFRKDAEGKGSYSKIMKTAQLLQARGVPFNILTVVTGKTAGSIERIYRFFRKNNFMFQQYIPCLEPFGEGAGGKEYSLTAEQYGEFLKQLFHLWYLDWKKGTPVAIRYFDNLLGILLGRPPESCGMSGQCSCQNAIEADGSVYPCDFYVLDPYRLGNLNTDSLKGLQQRGEQSEFVRSSKYIAEDCKNCRWLFLCRGGCRRERDIGENGLLGKNRYCAAYQDFFEFSIERFAEIARTIR